jgi:hypothetical protein
MAQDCRFFDRPEDTPLRQGVFMALTASKN